MFKDEIKDYTIDDIELILKTQKDLYSEQKMQELRSLLHEKLCMEQEIKEAFVKQRLPKIINCSKCEGPNPFSNEKCGFCGAKLEKKQYYDAAYLEHERVEPSEDERESLAEGNSYTFQYIISFIIPFLGFIMGAIMLSTGDEERSSCGNTCIILGLVSIVLYAVLWACFYLNL